MVKTHSGQVASVFKNFLEFVDAEIHFKMT